MQAVSSSRSADTVDTVDTDDHDRIWRRGPQGLADTELLAMLLGPSTRANANAYQLQRGIGNVAAISRASPRELSPIVGDARAARVAAAFELGRRAVQLRAYRERIGNAEDIYRLTAPRMSGQAQELFIVIALDIRNGLLDLIEIARGTANGVEVHPREVFRSLIRMNAAGGVLAHNHPSGDPTPSSEDIALTHRMQRVGELIGIPIIDHVVVAQNGFRSIAEWSGPGFPAIEEDG